MTVRELRKVLREFNPDAIVKINGLLDDMYNRSITIKQIRYKCPKGIDDPWRAEVVEFLHEEAEEKDDSTGKE